MAVVNVWVGVRLEKLVPESSLDNVIELERRIERAPDKSAVKVLVFGNSHAVAGLRPPAIAEAIGVRPEEVFSLAMPGASPREMRLLAERHLSSFPAARQAVIGVDEYFLSAHPDARVRYLTRTSVLERWRYASTQPKLDDRLGLMAGMLLPVADFAVALRWCAVKDPGLLARRLVTDAPVLPGSLQDRLAAIPYPWGYPPPWDDRDLGKLMAMDWDASKRAWHLMGDAAAVPAGIEELDRLVRMLETRGARPTLAEMPYDQPLAAALANATHYDRHYKQPLAAYMAASGQAIVPAPAVSARHFYDLDHLNPAGAELMAGWLKKRLVSQADVRIGGRP
ncbi:MAG: hypothetical protein ACK46X_05550 [Candidatus Sericytochromatia bacterium]